jgi:hypothetical protein
MQYFIFIKEVEQRFWNLVHKKQKILKFPIIFHDSFKATHFIVGCYKYICTDSLVVKMINKL